MTTAINNAKSATSKELSLSDLKCLLEHYESKQREGTSDEHYNDFEDKIAAIKQCIAAIIDNVIFI